MSVKRVLYDRDLLNFSEKELVIKTVGEVASIVFDVYSNSEQIARNMIIDTNVHKCYIVLYKDKITERSVGFSIARFIRGYKSNYPYCFLRGSSGILPEYRKNNITQYDLLTCAFKYRICFNLLPLYFVGYFPSPEGYKSFADIYPFLYPSKNYNDPRCEERKVLFDVSEMLGYKNIYDSKNFFFYNFSKVRTSFDIKNTNKNVEYFCKINPNYVSGVSLGGVLKLSFRNMFIGALLYFVKRIKKSRK